MKAILTKAAHLISTTLHAKTAGPSRIVLGILDVAIGVYAVYWLISNEHSTVLVLATVAAILVFLRNCVMQRHIRRPQE